MLLLKWKTTPIILQTWSATTNLSSTRPINSISFILSRNPKITKSLFKRKWSVWISGSSSEILWFVHCILEPSLLDQLGVKNKEWTLFVEWTVKKTFLFLPTSLSFWVWRKLKLLHGVWCWFWLFTIWFRLIRRIWILRGYWESLCCFCWIRYLGSCLCRGLFWWKSTRFSDFFLRFTVVITLVLFSVHLCSFVGRSEKFSCWFLQ